MMLFAFSLFFLSLSLAAFCFFFCCSGAHSHQVEPLLWRMSNANTCAHTAHSRERVEWVNSVEAIASISSFVCQKFVRFRFVNGKSLNWHRENDEEQQRAPLTTTPPTTTSKNYISNPRFTYNVVGAMQMTFQESLRTRNSQSILRKK